MSRILTRKFFNRKALEVAPELLGKFLVRRDRGKITKKIITEVEAYDGKKDLASHAAKGVTPRNKIMFGEPAYWYVYFVYGFHNMLNVVTAKKGYPAAVLIRGIEGVNGPGRVTKFLKIDRKFNKEPIKPISNLWIESGLKINKKEISRSPRIGVNYAGPIWSKKLYRFYLNDKFKQ